MAKTAESSLEEHGRYTSKAKTVLDTQSLHLMCQTWQMMSLSKTVNHLSFATCTGHASYPYTRFERSTVWWTLSRFYATIYLAVAKDKVRERVK